MKKEKAVPNFVENEHNMLSFWQKNKIQDKYLNKNNGSEKHYRFLDGPMTANANAGLHHAWNRTLKDAFLKFKTMQGYSAHYQNGFDAQGLWVEVETEKDLKLNDKRDIEKFGLDKFTETCMARVNKYASIISNQSKRLGQFMDWDNSYFTNSDENITSIWHFLKICHEKGWLVKKYCPMPWCSHCGTSLSEHELADSYKDMEHEAVFFKLPILNTDLSILVWTTTPWTLAANVAVAINPNLEYAICSVKSTNKKIVVADSLKKVLKDDLLAVDKIVKGTELVGLEYETCFEELSQQDFVHKIVAWDDVSSEEGTGAVHIAPGCGLEDFELGKTIGLKNIIPVDENGKYYDEFEFLAGRDAHEVQELVFEELANRGKLYYTHKHKHRYPVCWRCKRPLIFRLTEEWYIKVEEIRPLLLQAVETVEWQPAFLKKNMIAWLENMGDWCISRKRFYGLPLPFYKCQACGKIHVIGSLDELKEKATQGAKAVESLPHLHRPYIDDIAIKCECGCEAKRVSEVGDCWLDAGITAFSTKKYFTDREFWEKNFPADVVIEMREQIRLWFYALLFMSVTITGKAPYKKVIGFGMLVSEDGTKFSKTGKNNIFIDKACDEFGADTIRYMFSANNMLADTRFSENICEEIKRKILGLWNVYVFFNTYACLDNPLLENYTPNESKLSVTDKWLIEITNKLIENAEKYYNENMLYLLIRDFEKYIDDLSNFYIRVNRKRYWRSDDEEDKKVAYWVLYHALKAVIAIMSPIMPFITEYIWQNMVREIEPKESESILLAKFPSKIYATSYVDLIEQTAIARDIITVCQRLRNESNIKVKQPLRKMFVCADEAVQNVIEVYDGIIKDELNIKNIIFEQNSAVFNDSYLLVNFKKAGAVLKGDVQKLKAELESLSDEEMAMAVDSYNRGLVDLKTFKDLSPDLFILQNKAKKGYVIATENNLTIVLDTTLDEILLKEGMYRELTRLAQVMRKEAGFNVEDRIKACFETESEILRSVINTFKSKIMQEVLIIEIVEENDVFDYEKIVEISDQKIKIMLKKFE